MNIETTPTDNTEDGTPEGFRCVFERQGGIDHRSQSMLFYGAIHRLEAGP